MSIAGDTQYGTKFNIKGGGELASYSYDSCRE